MREVDLENPTEADREYVVQRPWLVAEAAALGHDISDWLSEGKTPSPEAGEPAHAPDPTPPAAPVVPEPGPEEEDDYDEWKLDELQEELVKRGLSKSGNKSDLIDRLRENDRETS